ncbi:putative photosynthetic complex assembly protein PuhE [uncultured Tateyamaria sp.]|uniref:putative photosynthetic complex assembly protein PuhE n=1 Tax=uncultured Tateyamaria sp. TaxID=455651 RepID=UPI00262DC96A|nr:putative photosynthetic complex assembly protein PuhE [uncultured Tateyamaria sp.]
MTPWIAALIALFIWWFSTGTILMAVKYADRSGTRARRTTTWAALPLMALGAYGTWWSMIQTDILGTYVAFLSALALWGWIELAFLTGIITGPNRMALPPHVPAWERFIRAWGTVAYHEMLLTATLIILGLVLWHAPNPFAFYTFAVLFFARISAKLNLFFGVPRINVDFLPQALAHLPSHFRTAGMNWLFPISVTALTFAAACWLERLYAADTMGQVTGFALLTALTALAALEHWVMVLPIPDERLWRWMLPAPKPTKNTTPQGGHHGL